MADPRQRAARGYSLVVLIMAVSVLNIMLAAALPKWSEMIRRDKEEELISRGWQYAEAIRIFQRRFQRYPVNLDELSKVKPRCIRQLYKDPMTGGGQWTLIPQGQAGLTSLPGTPNLPGAANPPGATNLPGAVNPTPGLPPGDPNQPQISNFPFWGVRSRSHQKSLLRFFGHDHYDEWEFRADMLMQGLNQRFGGAAVRLPVSGDSLSTRWLGRPMPDFVSMPGGIPSGNLPGGGPATQPPPNLPGGPGPSHP